MDATTCIPILARIPGELIWAIIVLAMVALSWIGRKIQEKNQQQQAEREYQRRRAEREHQRAQQRRGVPAPPVRPAPPLPVRTRPVGVAPARERAHRRVAPPAPPAQPDVGALQNRHIRVSVEEEVRRQEDRLAADVSGRRRRMAARRPLEADTAVGAKPVRVRPSAAQKPAAPRKALVLPDLGGPDRLRLAIIYHEIFSAPRALRGEPEIWQ